MGTGIFSLIVGMRTQRALERDRNTPAIRLVGKAVLKVLSSAAALAAISMMAVIVTGFTLLAVTATAGHWVLSKFMNSSAAKSGRSSPPAAASGGSFSSIIRHFAHDPVPPPAPVDVLPVSLGPSYPLFNHLSPRLRPAANSVMNAVVNEVMHLGQGSPPSADRPDANNAPVYPIHGYPLQRYPEYQDAPNDGHVAEEHDEEPVGNLVSLDDGGQPVVPRREFSV